MDRLITRTIPSQPISAQDSDDGNTGDGNTGNGNGDRVAELEREVTELREALLTRQLIGWVAGVLAERFGLEFDEAWGLLVRLSQNTNVKLRDVARVIADAYSGELSDADQPLARQLDAQLGTGLKLAGAARAGRYAPQNR